MVSDSFRWQLRREAEQWQADGLITPEQLAQIAERYQFHDLETGARDRFILILIGLGSLLLGLGAITFVAANWQLIPRGWKLTLLMTVFFAVNIAGYFLWKSPTTLPHQREGWRQRLGKGLLLLGALILGANLALTGQLFHRSGTAYELCLIWGLGVLAMAFGLRLTMLGIVAILIMGIGYWYGIWELTYVEALPGLNLLMQYMPLVSGIVFIGLAYWCRSRVIFALGAIAMISSLEVVIADVGRLFDPLPGLPVAIAFVLPPALLWSYSDDVLLRGRFANLLPHPFRPIAQGLASLFLLLLTYGMSFHWVWSEHRDLLPISRHLSYLFTTGSPLLLNLNLVVLTLVTLVGWFLLARPGERRSQWGLAEADAIFLVLLATIAVVTYWHWGIHPIQAIATLVFNIVLFLMASSLIRNGLAQGSRLLFWCGLVTLSLQILSRMLEYDTGLLLKSIAFVLCGVGVLLIGFWFERHVRQLNQPAAIARTSQEETP